MNTSKVFVLLYYHFKVCLSVYKLIIAHCSVEIHDSTYQLNRTDAYIILIPYRDALLSELSIDFFLMGGEGGRLGSF